MKQKSRLLLLVVLSLVLVVSLAACAKSINKDKKAYDDVYGVSGETRIVNNSGYTYFADAKGNLGENYREVINIGYGLLRGKTDGPSLVALDYSGNVLASAWEATALSVETSYIAAAGETQKRALVFTLQSGKKTVVSTLNYDAVKTVDSFGSVIGNFYTAYNTVTDENDSPKNLYLIVNLVTGDEIVSDAVSVPVTYSSYYRYDKPAVTLISATRTFEENDGTAEVPVLAKHDYLELYDSLTGARFAQDYRVLSVSGTYDGWFRVTYRDKATNDTEIKYINAESGEVKDTADDVPHSKYASAYTIDGVTYAIESYKINDDTFYRLTNYETAAVVSAADKKYEVLVPYGSTFNNIFTGYYTKTVKDESDNDKTIGVFDYYYGDGTLFFTDEGNLIAGAKGYFTDINDYSFIITRKSADTTKPKFRSYTYYTPGGTTELTFDNGAELVIDIIDDAATLVSFRVTSGLNPTAQLWHTPSNKIWSVDVASTVNNLNGGLIQFPLSEKEGDLYVILATDLFTWDGTAAGNIYSSAVKSNFAVTVSTSTTLSVLNREFTIDTAHNDKTPSATVYAAFKLLTVTYTDITNNTVIEYYATLSTGNGYDSEKIYKVGGAYESFAENQFLVLKNAKTAKKEVYEITVASEKAEPVLTLKIGTDANLASATTLDILRDVYGNVYVVNKNVSGSYDELFSIDGKKILPAIYDIGSVANGIVLVRKGAYYGVVDTTKKEPKLIKNFEYSDGALLVDGSFILRSLKDFKWTLYSSDNKKIQSGLTSTVDAVSVYYTRDGAKDALSSKEGIIVAAYKLYNKDGTVKVVTISVTKDQLSYARLRSYNLIQI
ncbi:MAG: hypothetical protein LBN25_00090 [Christensenellaceae bacterium]|jgi:hypothetical protein|nr:hypothetical protein [Christensenellaceae bacterium]